MAIGYAVSTLGLGTIMVAPAIFSFGLIAFGFLGMGRSRSPSIPTAR